MKPYANMSDQPGMLGQIPSQNEGGLSPIIGCVWARMRYFFIISIHDHRYYYSVKYIASLAI